MAIQVFCANCSQELQEPGAIVLSPPEGSKETVQKLHLCKACWRVIEELIKRGV